MKKMKINRRDFLRISAVTALLLPALDLRAEDSLALTGKMDALSWGGRDISPGMKKDRVPVPSACWQCVTRDGIIGYVENGRLMKIEGNPELPRTNGRLCARGQGGVGQVYDPDRLLYPMKRVGPRGSGKWKRISWDEATDIVTGKLKKLKDSGHQEKFMFHYGRMKGSSGTIIKKYFLHAYGTKTIGNHTSICEGGKWVGQELTWGHHYDNWDVLNAKMILNFGSNIFEAHTNHIPVSQRLVEARAKGAELYTFDVRLSNTAAKSDKWYPVVPGTDSAVILAMCNVIISKGLYNEKFINDWTNVTVPQLKKHLQPKTPEWAEKISGVPAGDIRKLAVKFAKAGRAVAISYRGLVAHYAGANNERALIMLNAICGYVNVKGGFCQPTAGKWKDPFEKDFHKKYNVKGKGLKILNGFKGDIAYPDHHANHQIFKLIKDGRYGRPDIYWVYCHNPAYVIGECHENIDILKDESLIPFIIDFDVAYSDTAHFADLLLPAATYLERWCADGHASASQIHEFYIRQPVVKPLGEVKSLPDYVIEIGRELGIEFPFKSHEEYVKAVCDHTPGVKEAGGFEYMKKHGAWYDKKEKPHYNQQANKLSKKDLEGTKVDEKTGIVFKGDKYDEKKGSNYVGQMIDGIAYKGFKPDKVNKGTGKLAIYSELLKKKGWNPLPDYYPIPEHQKMDDSALHLTTFKVAVQTHSRTQNCKLLTELYHENPVWINPETAEKYKIRDGDLVKITSEIGTITSKARVTNGIHPRVVAISFHCGHWQYGRYASGHAAPLGRKDDPDLKEKWWNGAGSSPKVWNDRGNGVHVNWIIQNKPDPISGQMRYMDTVVHIQKA